MPDQVLVIGDDVTPKFHLDVGQGEAKSFSFVFSDTDNDPYSFEGDTITARISNIRQTAALGSVTCTVSTTDHNRLTLPFTSTNTATAGTYRYVARSALVGRQVLFGAFTVARAVQ